MLHPIPLRSLTVLAAAAALGACSTVVPAPQSQVEMAAFASQHVNLESVPEATRRTTAAVGFKTTPDFQLTLERNDGKEKGSPRVLRYDITVQDIGGGLVREVQQATSNGFPTGTTVAVSAHGWRNVKSQFIASAAKTVIPVKSEQPALMVMDNQFANPKVGQTMSMETNKVPLWKATRSTCKVEAEFEASSLHRALSGKAYTVNCENAFDGVAGGRTTFAYISALNFAVIVKGATAQESWEYAIKDVKIGANQVAVR